MFDQYTLGLETHLILTRTPCENIWYSVESHVDYHFGYDAYRIISFVIFKLCKSLHSSVHIFSSTVAFLILILVVLLAPIPNLRLHHWTIPKYAHVIRLFYESSECLTLLTSTFGRVSVFPRCYTEKHNWKSQFGTGPGKPFPVVVCTIHQTALL